MVAIALLSLLCRCCSVVALLLLCCCSVVALSLLCRCSVVALSLLCHCSVVALSLLCCCLVILSLFLRLPTFIYDSAILCSGYSMALHGSSMLYHIHHSCACKHQCWMSSKGLPGRIIQKATLGDSPPASRPAWVQWSHCGTNPHNYFTVLMFPFMDDVGFARLLSCHHVFLYLQEKVKGGNFYIKVTGSNDFAGLHKEKLDSQGICGVYCQGSLMMSSLR